jgi:nucleotide-binding universal stress UspA family protein
MKTILVGIDGSPESQLASKEAARLARATDSRLLLAHVLNTALLTTPEAQIVSLKEWEDEQRRWALQLLEEVRRREDAPGLRIDLEVLMGQSAEAIAQRARGEDVMMVVVGHRGRGAVARVLLGSVADRLVQICPKPVLVTR